MVYIDIQNVQVQLSVCIAADTQASQAETVREPTLLVLYRRYVVLRLLRLFPLQQHENLTAEL